jgi:hypothetical protein
LGAAPAIAPDSMGIDAASTIVEETAKGKITAIELDYHNFTIEVKGKEVRIFITEDTKYIIAGKPGKKADALKVGVKVKVTHTDNIAASVEVE